MNVIEVRSLVERMVLIGGRTLDDPGLPPLLLGIGPKGEARFADGWGSGIVQAGIEVSVELFNDANDRDDDGIIGAALEDTNASGWPGSDWHPLLTMAPGQVWIKTVVGAELSAQVAHRQPGLLGAIGAQRALRLLSYRRHPANVDATRAVAEDLRAFANPLQAEDVLALPASEATAIATRGKLTGTLTLRWSDILSGSLQALPLIPGADNEALIMELDAQASLRLAISIEDDFRLCFHRPRVEAAGGADGAVSPIHVALRRSRIHDARFSTRAVINVGFADPEAVRALVAGSLASLLDAPAEAMQAIADARALEFLPPDWRGLAQALLERFGLRLDAPMAMLQGKLAALDARLNDRLRELARAKAALGLQYEYSRIASEAAVFQATLSPDALACLHPRLLHFDLDAVLADDGPGVSIDYLLHQKSLERVRAFGFTLGLGHWLRVQGRHRHRDRFITRDLHGRDGDRGSQAYLGSTEVSASFNTWSSTLGATLKADREAAEDGVPLAGVPFETGLHLWWEDSRLSTAPTLDRLLDDAQLWGALAASAVPAATRRVSRALAGASRVGVRLDWLADDAGARAAFRRIADATDADWARHAARALPWRGGNAWRGSPAQREHAYLPFFLAYARDRASSGVALKRLVAQSLPAGPRAVAAHEALGNRPWTLYQVLLRSGVERERFWTRWNQLRDGSAGLVEVFAGRSHWRTLDNHFSEVRPSLEQAWLLRAVSSLLSSGNEEGQDATLTLRFTRDGRERSLVIGGRRG